jgi:MFS transporter, DHA2 family, multidrug resistance protein
VGGAFGVAMLGTSLTNRTAFHQAVLGERITTYNYYTQSALQGVKSLGQRIGETPALRDLQAPAILGSYVAKQSAIAAYQDAFIITGVVCFVALIPALGLLKYKHAAAKKPDIKSAPAPK